MKTIFLLTLQLFLIASMNSQVIKQQISLEGNNIRTFIWNTGVFNQDLRTVNTPGLEWPKNSGKSPCFTAGFCVGGYVNNELRVGVASYAGEYRPGYCINGQFYTDSRFKHYKIRRGDNFINNPDWLNWGLMVPFGAPYIDANNSGYYEYYADTPGVKHASETVFICITDGDSLMHTPSEGFGGGTRPLFAEVHLTAWCYDKITLQDIQFFKWEVVNRSTQAWDSTIFSIVADPDLGDASDDYIGCDTLRNLGYCYNSDNNDGDGSARTYGVNPPAWGIILLNCSGSTARLSSFANINSTSSPGPICEREPNNSIEAYRFFKGVKKDETPWVNILTNQITRFCYPGDPETSSGWTQYDGRIENCGGSLIGPHTIPAPPGNRTFAVNYRPINHRVNPGESHIIIAAQLVARGSDHKNSVTLLKQLSDSAKNLCQNGFVIGISPISSEIPVKFELSQNYPNPFNPVTKIKFNIPYVGQRHAFDTKLSIYDALGREVAMLVNELLNPGIYSVDWNASNYPSGIYFYRLSSGDYIETRKMVLLK